MEAQATSMSTNWPIDMPPGAPQEDQPLLPEDRAAHLQQMGLLPGMQPYAQSLQQAANVDPNMPQQQDYQMQAPKQPWWKYALGGGLDLASLLMASRPRYQRMALVDSEGNTVKHYKQPLDQPTPQLGGLAAVMGLGEKQAATERERYAKDLSSYRARQQTLAGDLTKIEATAEARARHSTIGGKTSQLIAAINQAKAQGIYTDTQAQKLIQDAINAGITGTKRANQTEVEKLLDMDEATRKAHLEMTGALAAAKRAPEKTTAQKVAEATAVTKARTTAGIKAREAERRRMGLPASSDLANAREDRAHLSNIWRMKNGELSSLMKEKEIAAGALKPDKAAMAKLDADIAQTRKDLKSLTGLMEHSYYDKHGSAEPVGPEPVETPVGGYDVSGTGMGDVRAAEAETPAEDAAEGGVEEELPVGENPVTHAPAQDIFSAETYMDLDPDDATFVGELVSSGKWDKLPDEAKDQIRLERNLPTDWEPGD